MSAAGIATAPAKADSPASLKPKEHGAYAILMIPIITALAVAGITPIGVAIAIASVAGFFAHEPFLVAAGHRGGRAKRNTPSAQPRAITLATIAIIAGATALAVGCIPIQVSLAACLVLATASFTLAIKGKHRTLGGQLFGVVGLSAPCVPILLAGETPMDVALATWTIWLIGFTSTTLAVRSVIASQKQQPRSLHWMIVMLATAAIVSAALAGVYWPLISLPMILMSWYLLFRPPPAKQLKRVGWTLVAGTVATATMMVIHANFS